MRFCYRRKKNDPDANSPGRWKHADFDELLMISGYVKSELPPQFHDVLENGFPRSGKDQKTTAERLLRIIETANEYPIIEISTSDAMLPTFKLSSDDRARVLELTSKMREIILASTIFDEAHTRRLLDRINAIEKQVHQEKGLLDVVLGGVSDVGDTLRKFGTDLKPLTDRMAEIKRLAQSSSDQYDQVPPPEEPDALPRPESPES